MTVITRFAPSPTGHLHLGHAYSALFAFEQARNAHGQFLLRIEDIDQGRSRSDYEGQILDDLRWLGIKWEQPVRRQSNHFSEYQTALDALMTQELVYPCFCTRKEIKSEIEAAGGAPQGPDGPIYPGTCRHLTNNDRLDRIESGEQHAFRLDIEKSAKLAGPLTWHDTAKGEIKAAPERFGDIIIARKDTPTSYHLAVTVDDHLQGVTLVTRGHDLFEATDIHRLLQNLLNLHTPEYHHHPLILDQNGKRLAKRDDALSIKSLRENGATSNDIKTMISASPHD